MQSVETDVIFLSPATRIYNMKKTALILLMLFSSAGLTAEIDKPVDNDYTLDLLLTRSTDLFDTFESFEANDPLGSFYDNGINSAGLTLNSPYHFFPGSNVGYFINYNLRRFSIDKQDISISNSGINRKDLGTSVTGYNLYGFVSMFYNFGEKIVTSDNHGSFKLGMGFGAGYLKADGNIVLTESTGQPEVNIDISDLNFNYGIYLDYRYGPWIFRIENSATEIKQDDYYFEQISQSFQVGYSIRL
jgi:hypothetical protein